MYIARERPASNTSIPGRGQIQCSAFSFLISKLLACRDLPVALHDARAIRVRRPRRRAREPELPAPARSHKDTCQLREGGGSCRVPLQIQLASLLAGRCA